MNFYPYFNDSDFIEFDLIQYYSDSLSPLIEDNLFSYKNKEYFESLKLIDKAIDDNPINSVLYSFKGFVLFKLDYFEDALTCFDAALNIDDCSDLNWLAKSIVLKKLKRDNEALLCYKEYVFLRYDENLDISGVDFLKKPIDFETNPDYDFKDYYSNDFSEFTELFSENNLMYLNHNNLTLNQYQDILNKIKIRSNEILEENINRYFVDMTSLDLIDKIILYVKTFSHVRYKSEGSDYGYHFINEISFDDRMYDSEKIFTLIHELTHHLIREIFQQSLMRMLNCCKNDLITYFVNYLLEQRELILMDEYCANKVQSRFMPHGYQEFGSYEEILKEDFDWSLENDLIYYYSQFGKSFSKDILDIVEDFIDIDLREEIKNQFILDPHDEPTNEIQMEDIESLNDTDKISNLNAILKSNFESVLHSPDEFREIYERRDEL